MNTMCRMLLINFTIMLILMLTTMATDSASDTIKETKLEVTEKGEEEEEEAECEETPYYPHVFCTVTVYHKGEVPKELSWDMDIEQMKKKVCPCQKPSVGWFCLSKVKTFIDKEFTDCHISS